MIDVRNEIGEQIYCSSSKVFVYRYLQKNECNPRITSWLVIHDNVEYGATDWIKLYKETEQHALYVIYNNLDQVVREYNEVDDVLHYVVNHVRTKHTYTGDYYIVRMSDKHTYKFHELIHLNTKIKEL